MPYWVVADTDNHKRGLMGPYETYSKALNIRDGMSDGHAEIYETQSYKRSAAGREIRHQRVKSDGVDEGFKNFSHEVEGGW